MRPRNLRAAWLLCVGVSIALAADAPASVEMRTGKTADPSATRSRTDSIGSVETYSSGAPTISG